jgi:hypothetical protein
VWTVVIRTALSTTASRRKSLRRTLARKPSKHRHRVHPAAVAMSIKLTAIPFSFTDTWGM